MDIGALTGLFLSRLVNEHDRNLISDRVNESAFFVLAFQAALVFFQFYF